MQESKTTEIQESISNIKLSLIFKVLGNLLLVLIKIVSLPIIAVCFFVSVGLDLIGKPIFAIITLLGSCAVLWSLWEIYSGKYPADRLYVELSITVAIAVMLGIMLVTVEYIPKVFAGIAGLLIALLPVWFK